MPSTPRSRYATARCAGCKGREGGGQLREQCDERYRAPLRRIGVLHAAAASQAHDRHDRRQFRPDVLPTRPQQAVHRMDVLHSRVAPPIILSCCYVSEYGFDHDDIPPRRRLPCDRNYSVPGPFHRFQHRSLSASQLQEETGVLPFCSSHWNHKRPQNYFPLFTQDPCQHVKVVPISLGKFGARWRATP